MQEKLREEKEKVFQSRAQFHFGFRRDRQMIFGAPRLVKKKKKIERKLFSSQLVFVINDIKVIATATLFLSVNAAKGR